MLHFRKLTLCGRIGLAAGCLLLVLITLTGQAARAQPAPPTPTSAAPNVVAPAPTAGPSAQDVLDRADAIEKRAQDVVNTVNTGLGVVQAVGVLVGLVGALVSAVAFVLGVTGYRNSRRQSEEAADAIHQAQAIAGQLEPLKTEIAQNLSSVQSVIRDFEALRTSVETLVRNESQQMDALHRQQQTLENALRQLVTDAETRLQTETNRGARALAYTQLAQRQYSLGNRAAAIRSLQRAHKLDPENPITCYFLGDLLARSDREGRALRYLRDARKSGLVEAALSYAYALRIYGDRQAEEARREHYYARSAAIFTRHWAEERNRSLIDISGESAFGALGGMYKRQGRWAQAIEIYRFIAEKVTPQSSYPVNNLALLYLQTGQIDRAMDQFRRSEQIARNRLAGDATDVWARFDIITASVALTPEATPDALVELTRAIDEASGLVGLPGPLRKLRDGLNALGAPGITAPCLRHALDRIDHHLAVLSAPATP